MEIVIHKSDHNQGVWKAVRAWSRRTLEKAGERVMDVHGNDENEDESSDASAGHQDTPQG